MKVVIRLRYVEQMIVSNCTFMHNDAGPIFDELQIIGLITKIQGNQFKIFRASTILIDKYVNKVNISSSIFANNQHKILKDFILENNIHLYRFFPGAHFNSSQSPIISVATLEERKDDIDVYVDISHCIFKD